MATWNEFAEFVRTNFEVHDETDSGIHLTFSYASGRSQRVNIWRRLLFAKHWALIESSFVPVGDVDVARVLRAASDLTVGGIVAVAGELVYRHAVPLEFLDADEFLVPLQFVTSTADKLEAEFTGTDTH